MQDIRQSAHREIREYDDSESGSASSECGSDNQPHNEDITIEINGDVHMDSGPQHALEATFSPRSYQLEMLEESLRRNIIVAMDTGSGKTHIAILRVIEELKNTPADKLVWFLAPSVDLCSQQHALLEKEIPAVQIRLLIGSDGMKKWKHQYLWDAVLKNVRVVVSTHQILLDALANDYVRLEGISLLIFDEAHECVGNSPGVQIIRDFYQRRKIQGLSVPHILGLSACPATKSKGQSLEKIEGTLDAICRTPKRCLADLLLHVNIPEFKEIAYAETGSDHGTAALSTLQEIYTKYDINEDPFIVNLRAEDTPRSKKILDECLMNHKTWCSTQIKAFYNTSQVILQELGRWAVDYYIAEVIKRTRDSVNLVDIYLEDRETYNERRHLCNLFASIELSRTPSETPHSAHSISDKVAKFIDVLPCDGSLCGMAFVKQRATVAVLHRLLSLHHATRSSLRIGTVVGSSRNSQQSANICDLFAFRSPLDSEFPDQGSTLEKFRRGELDLIITTTVSENGIDIPACNMVICFDEPSNLKSFVQRRGRARMKESKLVLMQKNTSTKFAQWQELELEMKGIYADEMRQLREKKEKEDLEQHDRREYRVGNTGDGALLNLDNAVTRLNNFCSCLPAKQHVDRHPQYIFAENAPAKVILPLYVDAAVRIAWSRKIWQSERNAKKDAAFEAYMALYKAGLVNDNLMPLLQTDPVEWNSNGVAEKQPSMVKANVLINPWIDVARAWMLNSSIQTLKKAQITIREACGEILSIGEILLPVNIPLVPTFRLYWNATAEFLVDVTPTNPENPSKEWELQQAQDMTRAIFNTAFGWRFRIEESDFCAPFAPTPETWKTASDFNVDDKQTWKPSPGMGLIRNQDEKGQPYIFEEYLDHKPCDSLVKNLYKEYDEAEENVPHLAVTRLPRRADFLHKVVSGSQQSSKRFSYVLPTTRCTVDEVPFRIVQFALLMPSILHRLEVFMIGRRLCSTVLADVKFNDMSLVVTALSASSAFEETNYQRLEFLGDSLLKMCTSIQLLAEYPFWHEKYLTQKRDQIISNSRLSLAALQAGLDRFIITKSFTGRKWRPSYVQDLADIDMDNAQRDISTKVLADVVEALFGAARIDGGWPKALACMRVFLPEINWQSLEDRRAAVFERALPDEVLPPLLEPLEKLIEYSFNKKALLVEAMTHASCNSGVASLERLEFLGDAVLDSIIVNAVSGRNFELSHVEMHHLRTAFVNADFLAFMCMEWAVEQEVGGVVEDKTTHSFHITTSSVSLALWKFMLRASHVLSTVQLEASKRHRVLRDEINSALASGSYYPWALLARLSAPKFCSDIVESLIGAVYIDSGSMEACEGIAERMGILPYLRRVIQDGVHTLHPKEELGILADAEKVKYVVEFEKKIIESVESRAYTCEVFIGKMSVALVSDGISREEAKTKAAEAAVRALKQRGPSGRGTVLQQEENITLVDEMNIT